MSEKFLTSEFSKSEQELIEKLKGVSSDSPEARELMGAWFEDMEKLLESDKSSRASLELNLKHAKICKAVGYTTEAWEALEAVRRLAVQFDEMDFYDEAMAIMDEIDKE